MSGGSYDRGTDKGGVLDIPEAKPDTINVVNDGTFSVALNLGLAFSMKRSNSEDETPRKPTLLRYHHQLRQ
jgi:hypothetical protein